MNDIRWGWICKVVAGLILAYWIGVWIINSVSETRANVARVGAQ